MQKNLTNRQVVDAWVRGQSAESHTGNLWCDSGNLYSYRTIIGYHDADGDSIVIDYTGRHSLSQTTACHVGLARQVADMDAEPWEYSTAPGTGNPRFGAGPWSTPGH